MYTVQQILQTKGHQVWSVQPDTTVFEALQLMADKNIGAVLVMEKDRLVGILSERDYARKVILQERSSKNTQVGDIMTTRVIFVRPNQTTDECMLLMTEGHFRHLPVMEDQRVAGIISIGDVVKAVISKQEFVIEQLENYITGGR